MYDLFSRGRDSKPNGFWYDSKPKVILMYIIDLSP